MPKILKKPYYLGFSCGISKKDFVERINLLLLRPLMFNIMYEYILQDKIKIQITHYDTTRNEKNHCQED